MKILMVLANLEVGGGADRQTVNLARELRKKEKKVELFGFYKGNIVGNIPSDIDLHLSEFRPFSPIKTLIKITSLARYVKRTKPQLIYTRLEYPSTVIVGKIFGIPTVISYVDHPDNPSYFRPGFKKKIFLFWRRIVNKLASRITANSHGVAEECEKYFKLKSKPTVIYNGINYEAIKNSGREPASHKWIEDKSSPLVVSTGRFSKQKGFEDLIDAFAILKKRMKVKLLIVGGGELEGVLREKIANLGLENTVSLSDWKANPYPFVAAADLYVQSSVHEGFSNSLLEAQALGIPTVSTDHPFGANEIIDDGENGLLVPVGDSGAIANAIEKVLKDDKLREKIKKNTVERSCRFSIETMISEYEKLFEEIVQ